MSVLRAGCLGDSVGSEPDVAVVVVADDDVVVEAAADFLPLATTLMEDDLVTMM